MSKYDIPLDISISDDARVKLLNAIKPKSTVLEFGPSGGFMTEYLKNTLECDVYIVEIDTDAFNKAMKFAVDGVCGDASDMLWMNKFAHIKFDYLLFSDVLEHLYAPENILRHASSLLKDDGRVLISVPNIGHNSIIINLLQNKFEYKNTGLLDNSHIRFFTYYSLLEMLDSVGLVSIIETATYATPSHTEFGNDYDIFSEDVDILKNKAFGNVYQFVFEAVKKDYYYANKNDIKIERTIVPNFGEGLKKSTLYFDTGNGFCEDETVILCFNGIHLNQEISLPPNTIRARFDPVEGIFCVVRHMEIFSEHGILSYSLINGFSVGDHHIFTTKDSQILIDIPNYTSWLTISAMICTFSDIASVGVLSNIEEYVTRLEQKNEQLKQTMAKTVLELREELIINAKALEEQTVVMEDFIATVKLLQSEVEDKDQVIQQLEDNIDDKAKALESQETGLAKLLKTTDSVRKIEFYDMQVKQILDSNMQALKYFDVYKGMLDSTSWKITAPLRLVSRLLQRKKRNAILLPPTLNVHLLFNVVIPVVEVSPKLVKRVIEHVLSQDTPLFNLYLFTTSDSGKELLAICNEYSSTYDNVFHIVQQSFDLKELVEINNLSEWILVVYPTIFIHHNALSFLKNVVLNKKFDFLYADNTVINEDTNASIDTMYKPDFSLELLRSYNYIGGFFLINRSILNNKNISFNANNEYDLLFKLIEHSSNICHVSENLYNEVRVECSTICDINAIADHLKRKGLNAEVCIGKATNTYKVDYEITDKPLLSIIIPNKDHISDLRRCIESILNKSTYDNFEIIIVENNSVEPDIFNYYDTIKSERIKVAIYREKFNFSAINNLGVLSASGDFYIFLNNDTEVITHSWMEELLMYGQHNNIGAVGAKLYYLNDTIQHAGLILGIGGVAANAGRLEIGSNSGYMNRYSAVQNMSGVTAACLMVSAKVFHEVGGFNESLPIDFNDVDLCLRIRRAEYDIVFNPYCELYHYESISRGADTDNENFAKSAKLFQELWKIELCIGDPFYNKNFDLNSANYKLNSTINNRIFGCGENDEQNESNLSILQKLDPYRGIDNYQRSQEVVHYTKSLKSKVKTENGLSIIILNLNKPELIIPLLDSLVQAIDELQQRGIDLEIVVGDTGSSDEFVLGHYEKLKDSVIVRYNMKYNFSSCNNELFDQVATKHRVLFINNDIIFHNVASTLEFIYNQMSQDDSVGIAGSYLLYPDMTVQHIGVDFFRSGEARGFCYHPSHREKIALPPSGFIAAVPAVTGAFLMVRSDLFLAVDGFDERYEEECQDVALCLSARRIGYEIVIAHVDTVLHLENATRPKGSENWNDRRRFIRKWDLFISDIL